MKKQRIIAQPPIEGNNEVLLAPDELVPLDFHNTPNNSMLAGSLSGNVFTAHVDGFFQFNMSSQAEIVDNYGIVIKHGDRTYQSFSDAPRNAAGQADRRICAQKNITLELKAGDTVELFDRQVGSENGAKRWPYSDTNRIEISYEG